MAALALLLLGAISWDDSDGATAAGFAGIYAPVSPYRVIDTRESGLTPTGSTITVPVGAPGNSIAVAVNLTIAANQEPGFLTAWSGVGGRPATSNVNTLTVDDAIAGFAIVPLGPGGTIGIYTHMTTGIIVDVVGFVIGDDSPVPPGITARITGYGPGYSITSVSGDVTNGTVETVDVRVDMHCPDGSVQLDYAFDMAPGATRGWSVICDGVFSTGGFVTTVLV